MLYFQSLADQICFLKICLAPDRVGAPRLRRSVWTLALWPEAYFSGEMEFSGLPRNSLVESLVVGIAGICTRTRAPKANGAESMTDASAWARCSAETEPETLHTARNHLFACGAACRGHSTSEFRGEPEKSISPLKSVEIGLTAVA